MRTAFTDLVGCEVPIQLAAMAGVGTLELAAAVATAGGLGMMPRSAEVPGDGSGVYGTNFLAAFQPTLEDVAATARRVRVVEFFYDWPAREYVETVHAAGALAAWQVGSVEEAKAAAECGCDLVIAQGTEAGGHVRGTTGLDDLLPAVLEAVSIPVLAAGGIATPARVAELIRRGAAGVRVGTAFLATPECGAHPIYVERLLTAEADDTVLTSYYDDGWPDAPHRVLRAALETAKRTGWRAPSPPTRSAGEGAEAMAMYAGTGVGSVKSIRPASEVFAELCRDL